MANDKTEATLAQLQEGIAKLTTSDEWKRHLDFQSKFHNYSFGNCMLIAWQMPTATRVAGFKKWNEFNRYVMRGQKAIRILAPMLFTIKDKDSGEKVGQRLGGFKVVSVFDASQTDGEPLPEIVHRLTGEDSKGLLKGLEKVAAEIGFSVGYEEIPGETNGYCVPGEKRIAVECRNEPAQQVKTLAHELGHALLHSEAPGTELPRGQKELEAESVAYVVCNALGLETDGYSFGYVAGWGGGEDAVKLIKASGERIQKGAQRILDIIDKA